MSSNSFFNFHDKYKSVFRTQPNIFGFVNGKLVSDFHKKAKLFNQLFAAQCTLVQNTSSLPVFNFEINNRLKPFEIHKNDLLLIRKNLNARKAHGWGDIPIWIMKSCGKSKVLPLKLLLKKILAEGHFLKIEKKCCTSQSIDLSVFFPYLVKFLKDLFLILCLTILNEIIFLQSVSLVIFKETLVLLSYCQLSMKFTKVFTVAQWEILKWFSSRDFPLKASDRVWHEVLLLTLQSILNLSLYCVHKL